MCYYNVRVLLTATSNYTVYKAGGSDKLTDGGGQLGTLLNSNVN